MDGVEDFDILEYRAKRTIHGFTIEAQYKQDGHWWEDGKARTLIGAKLKVMHSRRRIKRHMRRQARVERDTEVTWKL